MNMIGKRTVIVIAIVLLAGIAWKYSATSGDKNTNDAVTVPTESQPAAVETVVQEKETTPVKKLVISAPATSYQFPAGAKTSFDASGDLKGGAFINEPNNASFVGRDLYILQQLNATIGLEVNPDAATMVFPAALRFPTDHDGVENVTGFQCGDAYTSDRDSYLLYALTQIRRGRSAVYEPFAFFGKLRAMDDAVGNYTAGQCEDVDGVTLEGRDRYLLDSINQLAIVEAVVE